METLTLAISIFFILQFFWSYYWNCYRTGYTIDIWHINLLSMLIVVHVMLPFARSDLNVFALGGAVTRMQAHVTQAYLISAFGYAGVLLGGSLWQVKLGLGLRAWFARLLELPARGPLLLMRNRGLLIAHGIVAVIIVWIVLAIYFRLSGFGFNLRGLLLTYPPLRPLAQFAAFYSVLIGSLCLCRYAATRDRSMLALTALLSSGLIFYGERSNLAAMATLPILAALLRAGKRLKLKWLLAGLAGIPVLVYGLNVLRQGDLPGGNALTAVAMELFYGNSFSDTRDFALVLSYWDGHYFLGLTYLAGLLSFVPRALSTFRDTWSIGVVTASMAGFSPLQHSGLRPGMFGEVFLNFGLGGVLALGVLAGASLRFVDMRMKQALRVLPRSSLRVYSYWVITSFMAALEITANASAVYSILVIFGLSWMFLRFTRFLKLEDAGA